MSLIKLTNSDSTTRGGVVWRTGQTVSIPESNRGTDLCEAGMLHVYEGRTQRAAVALGLMLNPIQAKIADPIAYAVRGEIAARDGPIKAGGHEFVVGRRLPVPEITTAMRVRFAIYCARTVVGDACSVWSEWAGAWLSGEDRSWKAAREAEVAGEACAAAARAAEVAAWVAAAAGVRARVAAWVAAVTIDLGALALMAIRDEKRYNRGD